MTATDIRDLPRPDAVIFDLDGTLVDTVETRIRAWQQVFEEVGVPATRSQLEPLIGVDGKRLAREVCALAGQPIDSERAEEIDKRCGEIYEELNQAPRPLPGVRQVFDVPLRDAATLVEKFKAMGVVRVHQVGRDPQAPEGKLALARITVTLSNTPLLVPNDQSLWSQVRSGLAFSLRGLSISASWLIVGVLFILPWALLLYALVWLTRRFWRSEATTNTPG